MSAGSKPAPVSPPPKPALVVMPSVKRPRSRRPVLVIILVLIAAAAVAYRLRPGPQGSPAVSVRTIKVQSGVVSPTLRVTGTTAARVYVSINAPIMRGPDAGRGLVLQSLIKSGSVVKAGDVIAQIDSQAIRDHADDVLAMVQSLDDSIKRRRADQAIELANWGQSIRVAKALLDKARLDYSARDIRTDIDREILKLNVDEAEASYNNLVNGLRITQEKFQSQMTLLRLQKERQARHHARHVHDVDAFTLHAPISGLLVLNTIYRGGDFAQVQEGDQLSPGQPFAKIVDIRTMELDSSVNQAESQNIRIGQVARIHLDAFPKIEFTGKVISMGALGVSSGSSAYWVRKVPLKIGIDGSDPQLIPDLSASADLQLAAPRPGVLVPLEAFFNSPAGDSVEVRQGEVWKEVPVTVSSRTNTVAIVTSGLQPGDEVALAHP